MVVPNVGSTILLPAGPMAGSAGSEYSPRSVFNGVTDTAAGGGEGGGGGGAVGGGGADGDVVGVVVGVVETPDGVDEVTDWK